MEKRGEKKKKIRKKKKMGMCVILNSPSQS